MKLNQKTIYALLFVLYLGRTGRANTYTVAQSMGLSTNFLEQVARTLRVGGVVKSIRGPGGGYELLGDPSYGQVLAAMGSLTDFVAVNDPGFGPDRDALALLNEIMMGSLSSVINAKILNRFVVTPTVEATNDQRTV